jgi:Rrf2 family protein
MIVNTKVRYGLRTMIEIAKHSSETGVLQKDIAVIQNISVKYLDHIISGLKISGLVTHAGGRKKGYKLTREAKNITIYDIWRAVQPEVCIIECLSPSITCERSAECTVKSYWGDLNTIIIDYLRSTTLHDLLTSPIPV